jgi:prophage regulatory protein
MEVPMSNDQRPAPVLVRIDDVVARFGLHGHEQVYGLMKDGQFPRPIRVGKRAVAWLESELQQWLAQRVAERDARNSSSETAEVSA